jgi:2-polyprenyl-3-methyl-5-hydroxy-6-metoxy-1,4-benzoquinol methylase
MTNDLDRRSDFEIEHGRHLAKAGAECIWGWETPAGKVRARRRAKMISEGANLSPSSQVLEIGCGTGIFTELFAESGAKITGLDISPELLSIAISKNLPSTQIDFKQGRFEDCPIEAKYDAIIGSSVLHHLDINSAIKRIFSLLRPEGIMCFTEPNMLNPQIALQKNIPWLKEKLGDSPYETAIVKWQLKKALQIVGFKEIDIIPFDWLHPATPASLIGPVSKIGSLIENVPIIREISGSVFIRAAKPG